MRSDHLKRHMKTHENGSICAKEIPSFDGSEFGTDQTKSKETMDELKRFVLGESPRKTARIESSTSQDCLEHKQNLPTKLLDEYAKPKSLSELYVKRNHDEDDTDEDDDEDDEQENVHDDDEENDDNQESHGVKFLLTNRIGLEKRFKKLFHEFTKEKKLENRTELAFLLDEMLRQGYVTPKEYESFNIVLADSLAEKDDIWKHIQSTTRLLIKDDKEELDKLIDEFKSEAGDDFVGIVLELEKLVEQYLNGKVTMTDILNISRGLENSSILLSKQYRFKMLLNDIAGNRHRVQTIFRRLNEAKDENTLNQLVREQLLSPEQYEKLKTHADAALDLNVIADVIKNTKVGRGLKFLPRTIDDLKTKLHGLIKDTTTMGLDAIKNELLAILDELLHKRGITKDEHTSINNDIKEGARGWGHLGYFM